MKLKVLFHRLYKQVHNYNLFIPGRAVYGDDDNQVEDPAAVLKRQKQATWLYVLLLICKLY